ncbi:hypothetical protein OSB04_028543 [Centaurea solstitialis]|uniref:CCHC-type domain-containing protein n=1 Tax=Centaurea solstitialis TaxID=347529 RepID=A0AA38SZH7_9ASTR|nr:hypothetical protein OSB04_028543 [Centaurea solstitialis]
MASSRWISEVEGAFLKSSCSEEVKDRYALNLLKKATKDWWNLINRTRTLEQITAMTWEQFKELFKEQHVRRGPRRDSENCSGLVRGREKGKDKSMAGRSLQSKVIPEPEVPPPPTRTTAVRGRGSGRGKGRGKGRARKAASVADVGARRQTRGNRRVQSEGPPIEPDPSHQESSASQPTAFVTREAFQTEMGKIQDALKTLLNQQEKSKSDGVREDSGMTTHRLLWTAETPPVRGDLPKSTHGSSYKEFVACKPPIYKGEHDPVLALRWIEEIEMRRGSGKWEGSANDPRKGRFPKADPRGGQNLSVRPCGKCQKVHQGDCRSGPPTCFRCGQPGHLSRDCTTRRACYQCGSPDHFKTECPQLKRGGTPAPRDRAMAVKDDGKAAPGKARRRAFRMTAEEAEEAPDVMTGTFLVNSIRAKVLFDTGADYSYATAELLKLCCVNLEPLDHPYEVDTANGRVWVREFARGCTIELEGCLMPVVLRHIPMEGLDVVLGMDWMIRNKVKIDCEQKMVRIKLPDGRTAVVYGVKRNGSTSLISVIKANRCIRKGCDWFLAYVVDSGRDKLEVKDVELVCEYPEVFPEDLVSLPPDREIEFRIDLVPGATPIAKAPYRLAPS